jgi:hypothetical protein
VRSMAAESGLTRVPCGAEGYCTRRLQPQVEQRTGQKATNNLQSDAPTTRRKGAWKREGMEGRGESSRIIGEYCV